MYSGFSIAGGWSAVCDDIGRLKLHSSNKISFDTAEAGPGEISGTLGDHPLGFEMTSSNRLKLVPPQISSGEHRLEILFNGTPFPGAPKLAVVQDLEVSRRVRLPYTVLSRLRRACRATVHLVRSFPAAGAGHEPSAAERTRAHVGQVRRGGQFHHRRLTSRQRDPEGPTVLTYERAQRHVTTFG